jgi:nucleoside-diphosphate-sugar epimerase
MAVVRAGGEEQEGRMPERVLVTGACGLVGSATVARLCKDGIPVVATDLDTAANRRAAKRFGDAITQWCDLTQRSHVQRLLAAVRPAAIIHLAAVIPPFCYIQPATAYRVNVEATALLVQEASALTAPPRFVQASSVSVYGPRNPHIESEALTSNTRPAPFDVYGAQKVAAEGVVRQSNLDWVILRLGGVMGPLLRHAKPDLAAMEGMLPSDGRIHMVDVRDAARAFVNAVTKPIAHVRGKTLVIVGDSSYQLLQEQIAPSIMAALGLVGVMPRGRKGDPNSTTAWFTTDWADPDEAQRTLQFQHTTWPDLLAERADRARWLQPLGRTASPVARQVLRSRAPYRGQPGAFADPWHMISQRWGSPLAQTTR